MTSLPAVPVETRAQPREPITASDRNNTATAVVQPSSSPRWPCEYTPERCVLLLSTVHANRTCALTKIAPQIHKVRLNWPSQTAASAVMEGGNQEGGRAKSKQPARVRTSRMRPKNID